MKVGHIDHTVTLLLNGQVLVAGGYKGSEIVAAAELYDPARGSWSLTASMTQARASHTATLLTDGRVLVAGGFKNRTLFSAELYDPSSGTWVPAGSMNFSRSGQTTTLLQNG